METTSVAIYSGAEHHGICRNKSSKSKRCNAPQPTIQVATITIKESKV
ncbi:hypothetical protein [Labilibaculum euxinus]